MATQVAAGLTLMVAIQAAAFAAPASANRSATQLLKNHALAACIAEGLGDSDAGRQAAAAAREYFEHGSLPIEAYTEAVLMARSYLARDYRNIYGDKLVFIKCIDFFNSRELGRLASKYSPKK